jgi:hypothetical protein
MDRALPQQRIDERLKPRGRKHNDAALCSAALIAAGKVVHMQRARQGLVACAMWLRPLAPVRRGVSRLARAPVPPSESRVRARNAGRRVLTARCEPSHAPGDTLGGTEARAERLTPRRNAVCPLAL